MNLYINSPSYYTQLYGVIDEIHAMCSMISKKIDVTLYTDVLDTIGITPIMVPNSEKENKRWAEYRKVNRKYRMASVSLYSDYEAFCNADINTKKLMILENIFRSLYFIKEKLNTRFDYDYIKTSIIAVARNYIEGDEISKI